MTRKSPRRSPRRSSIARRLLFPVLGTAAAGAAIGIWYNSPSYKNYQLEQLNKYLEKIGVILHSIEMSEDEYNETNDKIIKCDILKTLLSLYEEYLSYAIIANEYWQKNIFPNIEIYRELIIKSPDKYTPNLSKLFSVEFDAKNDFFITEYINYATNNIRRVRQQIKINKC